ncbi:hypothetical protein BN2476_1050006 [Paraburkholderia piptadeniae]|uniref:BREX system Lon protease-like BrxL N-terminal domain-containing protein n=1 Tax=Paraburkholderia piptadeniae TaxID=1701573 RepID=A0A1N7SUK2_9BURK|nr:BREX system Lon protease-like protein BrxL [Paraburkholderia piptadeniae]SIT51171.1 hypothetical protein BN2476_1050006 [Paraburkholderia piptadeniae]
MGADDARRRMPQEEVKVRLVDSDFWAEVTNFGHKNVHVPEHYVRDYERLVMGGVWAQVDMRFEYDEESRGKNPFWIDKLTPIQMATFDLEEYRRVRSEFTRDEWLDLIMRSMGYEPDEMSRRLKLLFLVRLIPLAERNCNLVELGPPTGRLHCENAFLAAVHSSCQTYRRSLTSDSCECCAT